jgi:RHS repeat-associated protein
VGNQALSSNQIMTLPKGGGAQHGLGEKFSPDLYAGTGNFTVPIAVPPGRNGFQPQLNLVYSTGNGNGFFGLGWSLSIPGVMRKSSKGIPRYRDYDRELKSRDTFILSGAEDLVPVRDSQLDPLKATRYRPRTEGLFAKIIHHHDVGVGTNYWEVCSKDGLSSYYGDNPAERVMQSTSATIANAKLSATDPDRLFAWKLILTKDPFGNRIEYIYEARDRSSPQDERLGHQWDQPLLTQIRYADYQKNNQTKFLVTVSFEYVDGREDPFSDCRAGFEIRTTKRCKSILVETRASQDYKVRRYDFTYRNNALNKVSLLTAVNVAGFDDAGVEARELPPLEFEYSEFKPQDQTQRDFYPIQGPDLPATSLANASVELVDLFGNGLPDVLEMNGSVRYWRNRGNGRFDWPRPMAEAPAGLTLTSVGVQLIDANGDGRTDLMVTDGALSGYYPLQFGGRWDRRSFQKYAYAPSFDLKDPEVRLIDLTGDGITDVIRSGSRLECFFNDQHEGWIPGNTRWVERQALKLFPNVNFSDPRVKFADMTGDGMQDIVLVYEGNVEYWPNLGYGNWGKRLHMRNSPRFPYGYDPKRILLGDVDGDGLSDLIYVDDRHITLWINQNGNGWSDPIEIPGTPSVSDMDATRLVDLLGSGISGVLWTRDATSSRQDHYLFLDLTGGTKPYVLHEMNNNMGAITKVKYEPSTKFYLEDEKKLETRWRTPLPFPVQVVTRVEVIDDLSKGKLTTEYKYHHGYWDGCEREFRGFGMVEQFDTETFEGYNKAGLHGELATFDKVDRNLQDFSPPTQTKTWFHQGPIGEEFGEWQEQNWANEYWSGDPQLLNHTERMNDLLNVLDLTYSTKTTQARRRIKRDALRTLRGSVLRTELYALDGSSLQDRPYTVTEQAYGVREESGLLDDDLPHVFFPHSTTQRTTQWERGDDPMTQFSFAGTYDGFGQPLSRTSVAVPRRTSKRHRVSQTEVADEIRVLATHTRTRYAAPVANLYIHDRVAHKTDLTLAHPPEVVETNPDDVQSVLVDQRDKAQEIHAQWEGDLENWNPGAGLSTRYRVFGHSAHRYDGTAYVGLAVGEVGTRGALTLSETLVFTNETLTDAYITTPLIDQTGRLILPTGAPAGFDTNLGYQAHVNLPGSVDGYYIKARQLKYDGRGLIVAQRDPLEHETTIAYDTYSVLPETVTDPVKLETTVTYNYRVLQPKTVTDPNANITEFGFSPIGLLTDIWVRGKPGGTEGDGSRASTHISYDFLAYHNSVLADPANPQPIAVRAIRAVRHDRDPADTGETIETREYSDGFGRLLQTRVQGEVVRFGDTAFGGGEEILPTKQSDGRGGALTGRWNTDSTKPNVTVSGWQRYDNKGRVLEKYEPFFDQGWEYDSPDQEQVGEKTSMLYDPRGQVISTVNPDGSEQRVIYGIPISLADPPLAPTDTAKFLPTPWEAYTYDANDLAPVSYDPGPTPGSGVRSLANKAPGHHYFTPSSIVVDSMGRALMTIQRNRPVPTSATVPPIEELHTRFTYDIQENLLTIIDPLKRNAFVHVYDLSKHLLRIESIDAGMRWMVLNSLGNEVHRRDGKGALSLNRFDVLNRSVELWSGDGNGQAITLRERREYGDHGDRSQLQQQRSEERSKNRLGKLARHYDEAGLLQLNRYDFKGNLLEKTRQVISDAVLATGWIADWSRVNRDDDLEGAQYMTSMQYDALNRPARVQYPQGVDNERALLELLYNRAGVLTQVVLNGETYVQRIAYDAKVQRIFIAYGNDILTRYAYDSRTSRLKRLRTEEVLRTGTDYQPTGIVFQDWAYDYDLSGNVLAVRDIVPGCGVSNDPDQLDRLFSYDAIYRLASATGRECNQAAPDPYWSDPARCQDVASTRPYTQTYAYDDAGNMTVLAHTAPNNGSFTRTFGMKLGSNRLDKVTVGPAAMGNVYNYRHDDNGNMTEETISRRFRWNHADRLQEFSETAGTNPSILARYLYDSTGMRVKKWVRRGGTAANDESTIYIDNIFERHHWNKDGGGQNDHLHVMDNQRRVAVVRKGPRHPDDTGPIVQYHVGDHLGSSNLIVGGRDAAESDLINREEFYPYGETSFGSFKRKRYRYVGKERDEESGLSYYGARYCAPGLSRWINCDPAGYVDGLNLFRYVRNNPMRYVDRDGKQGSNSDAEPLPDNPPTSGKETSVPIFPPPLDKAKICITGNESKADLERKMRVWSTVGSAVGRDSNLAAKAGTVKDFYALHDTLMRDAMNDLSDSVCGDRPFSTFTAGTYSRKEGVKMSDKVTDRSLQTATMAHEIYHALTDEFLKTLSREEAGKIVDQHKYSVKSLQSTFSVREELELDIRRCEEFIAYQITIEYLYASLSEEERQDASALTAAYAQSRDQRLFSRSDNQAGVDFAVRKCYQLLPGRFSYDSKKNTGTLEQPPVRVPLDAGMNQSPR